MIQLRGFVTLQAIGLHCWPQAPLDQSYLRNAHRHVFKVRIEFDVTHVDREIEFHQFQAWAQPLLDHFVATMPLATSCESIALHLLHGCVDTYGPASERHWLVEVSEDGENGAQARGG